ncbi:MAG: PorT family protein [Bacteroidales bacterium]|nr:PorT family protein [Bacteroidales bacterium]
MKALLIILIVISFCTCELHSQNIQGAIILGGNLSKVDGDEVDGWKRLGLNIGASAMIPLNDKFFVGIETIYNQKGSYEKGKYVDSIDVKYKLILDYVEVPVLAYYKDKGGITVGTGFSWGRRVRFREWENGSEIKWSTSEIPYDKNDICWVADIRFKLINRLKFNFRYSNSISKIRTKYYPKTGESRDQYNRQLTFRLIYVFNEKITRKS